MCAILAEKYGLYHCGENYKMDEFLEIETPKISQICSSRERIKNHIGLKRLFIGENKWNMEREIIGVGNTATVYEWEDYVC